MPEEERRAPVQGDFRSARPGNEARPGTVPWSVHLKAWDGYNAAGHGNQSAERIAERGGFSYGEIQCCLAGCYNKCGNAELGAVEG